MLAEARRHAAAHDVEADWIEARAEDLATLELPAARLVTFGQSIHWTDRQPVLATVHELLAPGGAVALIAVSHRTRDAARRPRRPADPARRDRAAARPISWVVTQRGRVDTYETSLEQSPFGESHVAHAPARTDIVRTTDEVVSGYLSMSFAAPDRFANRLDAFMAELQALLTDVSPAGRFHDWPGDTVIIRATKRVSTCPGCPPVHDTHTGASASRHPAFSGAGGRDIRARYTETCAHAGSGQSALPGSAARDPAIGVVADRIDLCGGTFDKPPPGFWPMWPSSDLGGAVAAGTRAWVMLAVWARRPMAAKLFWWE